MGFIKTGAGGVGMGISPGSSTSGYMYQEPEEPLGGMGGAIAAGSAGMEGAKIYNSIQNKKLKNSGLINNVEFQTRINLNEGTGLPDEFKDINMFSARTDQGFIEGFTNKWSNRMSVNPDYLESVGGANLENYLSINEKLLGKDISQGDVTNLLSRNFSDEIQFKGNLSNIAGLDTDYLNNLDMSSSSDYLDLENKLFDKDYSLKDTQKILSEGFSPEIQDHVVWWKDMKETLNIGKPDINPATGEIYTASEWADKIGRPKSVISPSDYTEKLEGHGIEYRVDPSTESFDNMLQKAHSAMSEKLGLPTDELGFDQLPRHLQKNIKEGLPIANLREHVPKSLRGWASTEGYMEAIDNMHGKYPDLYPKIDYKSDWWKKLPNEKRKAILTKHRQQIPKAVLEDRLKESRDWLFSERKRIDIGKNMKAYENVEGVDFNNMSQSAREFHMQKALDANLRGTGKQGYGSGVYTGQEIHTSDLTKNVDMINSTVRKPEYRDIPATGYSKKPLVVPDTSIEDAFMRGFSDDKLQSSVLVNPKSGQPLNFAGSGFTKGMTKAEFDKNKVGSSFIKNLGTSKGFVRNIGKGSVKKAWGGSKPGKVVKALANIGKGGLKDLAKGSDIAKIGKAVANIGKGGLKGLFGAGAGGAGGALALGPAGWTMLALSLVGGKLFKPHTALGKIFSDPRLKENIKIVGKSPSGINVYEYDYKNVEGRFRGVLANEVPWASSHDKHGHLMVDYSKVDVDFMRVK